MAVRRKREQEPDIQKADAEQVRETGGIYAVVSNAKAVRTGASQRKSCLGDPLGFRFESHASVIEQIKRGFDVDALVRLSEEIQIPPLQLAEIVSIAKRTLARRKREGRLQWFESEKIYRIAVLFDRAVQVLGGAEQARQWLKTPKRALGEQTPLQHSDTEVGAREVEDLLGRLEYGVFS